MNGELIINLNDRDIKVFLQQGFFSPELISPTIHTHNYTEIHAISGGEAEFTIEKRRLKLSSGEMLIIPKDIPHCISRRTSDAKHTAFQIDIPAGEPSVTTCNSFVVDALFSEAKSASKSGRCNKIAHLISALIADISSESQALSSISDYRFLINEFFQRKYNEQVTLGDLAADIHTSERHAERLVKKYRGRTFGKELTATRIKTAIYLMNNTSMPLTEIAEYVGYCTYSGFWKALKQYEK